MAIKCYYCDEDVDFTVIDDEKYFLPTVAVRVIHGFQEVICEKCIKSGGKPRRPKGNKHSKGLRNGQV